MVKRRLASAAHDEDSDSPSPKQAGVKRLASLKRVVSPPPPASARRKVPPVQQEHKAQAPSEAKSVAAAVEAGEKDVVDHLAFYSEHLLAASRPCVPGTPRIDHQQWIEVYQRNAGSDRGHHFVVHQHDHPVAGTHYDLRLQCNATSSISFAIMYGLPGNANSVRLNRNATETRVHCLWNHLIEAASFDTGSMLVWDTGEYEVLPYRDTDDADDYGTDDDTERDIGVESNGKGSLGGLSEPQKLHRAFARRKMKLRLHGTRLPVGYTLSLRLPKHNDRSEQPKKPVRRRKRRASGAVIDTKQQTDSEGTGSSSDESPMLGRTPSSLLRHASPPPGPKNESSEQQTTEDENGGQMAVASDDEDERIRQNNAYLGATNDIGSIHQRKWYLSMDRAASGFVKRTIKKEYGLIDISWHPRQGHTESGFEAFIVGGRETERSIVTGRLAKEILEDEGVVGYVPRGLWRPVIE